IWHTAGIPHSPTAQSIVERTHQTLKRVLDQQRGGTEINSPAVRLCKALFTINFLNSSFSESSPHPGLRQYKEEYALPGEGGLLATPPPPGP
ncbi:POK19 protein, partial [Atrichornis clamosus]|nr:POK19 protein [Atrichornis clamosus]